MMTNTLWKALVWVIVNSIFGAFVYMGFVEGIEGAKNVAVFAAWCLFLLSLTYPTKGMQKILRENPPSVHPVISVTFDICIVAVFVWYSAWWTGVAYFMQLLLIGGSRGAAKKTEQETRP